MRPDIPPEPIQPHRPRRRPRPRRLKHPPRNPQRRIRRHNLDARNPLRHLAPLRRRDVSSRAVAGVGVRNFGAREVGEGFGGAEVGEEGAVAGEDVGFGRGGGGGGGGVGPGAGVFGCVGGGEGEGAERDADVEIGEDELDAGAIGQHGSAVQSLGEGMEGLALAGAAWPMEWPRCSQ